ncbi:putative endoplasmic reticulum membrane protein [Colletotrichum spinosum]|uniref:Putative endoplasmic reticulum membrane protein n=1 Tax=Colletotrichum spinosum TaxID=1347390 RepID=A0A4R8Q4B1_9PEZI|nr:putative endoplasmic reticulum membrane protein [Colletotrichum spinosum]
MKLFLGLATALVGVAPVLASDQPADVYLLQSRQSSSSPEIPTLPRQIARLILLQRMSPDGKHGTWDLPEYVTDDKAVEYLNEYGLAPHGLFANAASTNPSQLIIMLEGIAADDAKTLQKSFGGEGSSFRVGDAPSAAANDLLLANDFQNLGVLLKGCQFDSIINPFAEQCWSGKSSVARYDVKKDSSIINSLTDNVSLLRQLAINGEMETVVIAMPESSRNSKTRSWSSQPQELRRRQVEEVMTESDDHDSPAPTTPAVHSSAPFVGEIKRGSIPSCFSSEEACVKDTKNCTGHGKCVNKYARADGKSSGTCFACACLATPNNSTNSKTKSITHWGGPACSKIDVSVPFWLFTGFGIAMIGVLTFAIGLLFNVGEEQLPGVIGAGVSRSK